MQKQEDELMKRFMEKQDRPKREKSEQSNQKTTSSRDCARRATPDALLEKRLQWLEELNAMTVSAHL